MKPIENKTFITHNNYNKNSYNCFTTTEWVWKICDKIDSIVSENIRINNRFELTFDQKISKIHNLNIEYLTSVLVTTMLHEEYNIISKVEVEHIVGMFNLGEYDDFYTDPASIKYHGNWIGGLFCHSLLVYKAALLSAPLYNIKQEKVSLIACIMHDFCKIGKYSLKVFDNNPDLIISYNDRDSRNYNSIQHGPESVRRIAYCWSQSAIINMEFGSSEYKMNRLTDIIFSEGTMRELLYSVEWEQAVAYHMGVFDVGSSEMKEFSNAAEKNPYVLLLHHADMIATKIYKI